MTTESLTTSLHAALDAAAPDGDSWLAGEDAFFASLRAGATVDESYYAALDAAAPDGGSWNAGYLALFGLQSTTITKPSRAAKAKDDIAKTATRTRDTVKSLLTRRNKSAAPNKEGSSS